MRDRSQDAITNTESLLSEQDYDVSKDREVDMLGGIYNLIGGFGAT